MNKILSTCLSAAAMLIVVLPPLAPAQSSRTIVEYNSSPQPGVVLDSWMEPVYSRKRQIRNSDGSVELIEEPIVQERHERVLLPEQITRTTVQVNEPAKRVAVRKKVVKRVAMRRPATKRYVARKKVVKRTVASKPVRSNRIVARRVTTQPSTSTIRTSQEVAQRAIIIERRDPSLNWY